MGQRLIHEEDVGRAHQAAADGDALALAVGELGGLALIEHVDAHELGDLVDGRLDLRLALAVELGAQREGDVVVYAQVGVERVVFKYHGHVSIAGLHKIDDLAVDLHQSLLREFAARDALEGGGFACARRAEEHEEFVVLHIQRKLIDGRGAVIAAGYAFKLYSCHR